MAGSGDRLAHRRRSDLELILGDPDEGQTGPTGRAVGHVRFDRAGPQRRRALSLARVGDSIMGWVDKPAGPSTRDAWIAVAGS